MSPAPAPAAQPGERIHAIDAIRGIAAIAVVLFHATVRYPAFMRGDPTTDAPLFPGFTEHDVGLVPVLWFFLISGFVITWTIDRCRTPMDFVVSRASRLYPTYWAAIVVTVATGLIWPLPGVAFTPGQVLMNLTMAHELVGVPSVAGVFWSLAVELRFYVFALAVFALGWLPRVHWAALLWAAAGLATVLLGDTAHPVPWRVAQLLDLWQAPYLVAGMMLYRLWRGQTPVWSAVTVGLCTVSMVLTMEPAPAATCMVVAGAILWSAHGGLRWLAARPLVWLGGVSYALYVSHEQMIYIVIRGLDRQGMPHAASVAVAVVAALVLAWAITVAVERPAMRGIRVAWRAHRLRSGPVRAE